MTEHHEQLILKSLSGTMTAAERAILNEWMNESLENKKLAEDLLQLWAYSKADPNDLNFETKEEWSKLEAEINENKIPRGKGVKLNYNSAWVKIAASIALIAVCSWLLFRIVFSHETIIKQSDETIIEVALPDGSEVLLNRNSRLAYQDDFNKEVRAVKLEGEAFFKVTEDAQKPFVVQTGKAQIKVLGTSFNVEARKDAVATEVSVVTGMVSLSVLKNDENYITINPGEVGVLENNKIVVLSQEEKLNAIAWKEKRLTFKKTVLNEVIKTLEEYFKVDINVSNKKVLHCRFTGSFDKPSLEEIIEALTVSLDLNISEQRDKTYRIDGNGC